MALNADQSFALSYYTTPNAHALSGSQLSEAHQIRSLSDLISS